MKSGRALWLFLGCCAPLACQQRAPPGRVLPEPRALAISPSPVHLGLGEQIQLSATASYADGSRRDVTQDAYWGTRPDAGASLKMAGRFVGERPGATPVQVDWGGLVARTEVEVGVEAAAPPIALHILPEEDTLPVGGARAFAAVEMELDGSTRDVTSEAEWATSNINTILLSAQPPGFLLAKAIGTEEAIARLGLLVAKAPVHVTSGAPTRPTFPLHVSSSKRFLEDAHGIPFRIQGEGAWSLIANLTAPEVDLYLEDRAKKGFNTVLVNLLEHRYAEKAPNNRAGAAPFRTPGDFSTPDTAYFDFAEAVVEKARARDFLVLLVPAYPGFRCPSVPSPENEGWSAEMGKTSPEACFSYGRRVGQRFGKYDNVVFVQGGDCMPTPGSALEACALSVLKGIQQVATASLETGHFSPNTTSLDEASFAPFMQLDAVYQYATPHSACRRAYVHTPPLPAFLIESGYENERIQGSEPPTRKYLYWGALNCTAGVVFGSRPIWFFGEGWKQSLHSPAAHDVARLGRLFDTLPWQDLIPSGVAGMRTLVTAGAGTPGGQDEVVAAATKDGLALVAYVPPGNGWGGRDIVVDVRALAGAATARWYNPSRGAAVPIGRVPNTTPWWFTTPGDNGSGYDDWVLVLTSAGAKPPQPQSAPGAKTR